MKYFLFVVILLSLTAPAFAKTVNLSWDASPSSGVTEYQVFMSPTVGELIQDQAAPVTLAPEIITVGLTAAIVDLPDGTVYYLGVTAGDGGTSSVLSNIVLSPAVFLPPDNLGGTTVIQNLTIPL